MLLSEPYTHWHWDDSCERLNRGQIAALLHAMVNEFQLIQGPPGTALLIYVSLESDNLKIIG